MSSLCNGPYHVSIVDRHMPLCVSIVDLVASLVRVFVYRRLYASRCYRRPRYASIADRIMPLWTTGRNMTLSQAASSCLYDKPHYQVSMTDRNMSISEVTLWLYRGLYRVSVVDLVVSQVRGFASRSNVWFSVLRVRALFHV
jgi:hypothetical protein